MNIDADSLKLVKLIDKHVNKFPDNEAGNTQLLTTIYDYMASFKRVMDSKTPAQMDYLTKEYGGFYRFAKLLEQMARGISNGTIQVPRKTP
jgi:hypothetical protein